MLVRREREAKFFRCFLMQNLIVFLSVSPPNFLTKLSLQQRKAIFILVIVEINSMTQIKEKKNGIAISVVKATVLAIRDADKNGFHCIQETMLNATTTKSEQMRDYQNSTHVYI